MRSSAVNGLSARIEEAEKEIDTIVYALFDLTATPEAENQGRFVELLARQAERVAAGGGPVSLRVLVDEAAFVRRFGVASGRIAQRRDAWRALLLKLGVTPLFVDLYAPDLAAAEQALLAGLTR